MTAWQQWLQHPERSWVRHVFFQIHLSVGVGVGLYVLLMSISGSMIVYRNEVSRWFSVEWLVNLHENLLSGATGRFVNGLGAICVTSLCLTGAIIWWPGIKNWRRSLTVNWRAHFARISWDLHSALGFWCFFFVLVWGISGICLCFPGVLNTLVSGQFLYWIDQLHFGRFGWFAEALWTILGLAPAILFATGALMWWNRVLRKTFANRSKEQLWHPFA